MIIFSRRGKRFIRVVGSAVKDSSLTTPKLKLPMKGKSFRRQLLVLKTF